MATAWETGLQGWASLDICPQGLSGEGNGTSCMAAQGFQKPFRSGAHIGTA